MEIFIRTAETDVLKELSSSSKPLGQICVDISMLLILSDKSFEQLMKVRIFAHFFNVQLTFMLSDLLIVEIFLVSL